jgi:uncharacterized protein YcfL
MRYALLAAVLVVAGCGSGGDMTPDEYPQEEPGPDVDRDFNPNDYEGLTLSEFGTELTRPIAKTIEWPGISTEEGARFVDDALVVDRIFREDADGTYGARIRIKNTTNQALKLEYVIRFYTRKGGRIAGFKGVAGNDERWTPVVIDSLRSAILDDSARVIGAEGFRLHVRAPGGTGDGAQTPPERLEEIRRQREAARNK